MGNHSNKVIDDLLLPYKFKPVGWLLILPGLLLLLIRYYFEIKASLLNLKVFAIYSTYLETKYFTVIENHVTEELGGLLLFLGFMFLNLSKEKEEQPEYNQYRFQAFIYTFYSTYLFLIISILFVFGIAFIKIILLGIVLQSLFYFIILRYFISRHSPKRNIAE